jgi:hypothetical protein
MRAGLQIDIEFRFLEQRFISNRINGMNLGMGFARFSVPSFPDNLSLVNDHTTDKRIRMGASQPICGQLQAATHVFFSFAQCSDCETRIYKKITFEALSQQESCTS